MRYDDLLKKYNVPQPPEWSGMIGSGTDQMFSVGGRWVKSGQKTPQGHTIESFDPNTGFLSLSYQGVPLVPLKMKTSVVQPYTPQFTKEAGSMTEEDMNRQEMQNSLIQNANSYLNDPTLQLELPKQYAFDSSAVKKMRENYLGNKDREFRKDLVDVVSLEQFRNIASSEDAQSGLYYVPYQDDDGNVDFHEFYMEGQQRAEEVTTKNADGTVETIKIPYAR